MVAQLPSNMLITRVRPSIYLPCCVLLWSCVSASTAAAKNFSSLVAIRAILGVVEAPFFPGVSDTTRAFLANISPFSRGNLACFCP